MPIQDIRATFARAGADDILYTWGVDGPAADSAALGTLDQAFRTRYPLIFPTGTFEDIIVPMSLVMWEAFPADGGPATGAFTPAVPFDVGTGVPDGPHDVQIVISRAVDTVRGVKPKGRQYWGPIRKLSGARPLAADQQNLLDWSAAWHGDLQTSALQPVVVSRFANKVKRPAAIGFPIVGYSVDNAYDTQRRRGLDPTSRLTGSVTGA